MSEMESQLSGKVGKRNEFVNKYLYIYVNLLTARESRITKHVQVSF